MNLDQPTLVQFETVRKQNGFIPPEGSNSFYNIGQGKINIATIRGTKEGCLFDISTDAGIVYTGVGNFLVSGDINDPNFPYRNMTVIYGTTLGVNHIFTVSKGVVSIYGKIDLIKGSHLYIHNDGKVILYPDSILKVSDDIRITVERGSELIIYGRIDVNISSVSKLLNVTGVTIDSAAVMNVEGIDSLDRPYSLTDYDSTLRERVINVHTQGEHNYIDGRIGYTWTGGDSREGSQIIRMSVLWGKAVLGDFKLSALGIPETPIKNLQMISDIVVKKDTTLYITEAYNGYEYIRPDLYLGIVIDNNTTPASCIIEGKIIVDGENCTITVDRGASLHIMESGILELKNGAIMRSTHNEESERVLFINGTLIIDDINQIDTFTHDNIVIGEKGKVIILNPDTGEKKLLWTTPDGVGKTKLYKLFEDRIDHVEYHISNNTGIGIDKFYEFYSRDMTNWYGGRRIEKAIHDGILVWHDGGFIELYNDITPWANIDSTLLHAARLFKTFGSYDEEKLQDAVDRLKYAGCGNILFRFINGDKVGEIMLTLEDITMKNVLNEPMTEMYKLTTDNDGILFIKNNVTKATVSNIVNKDSRTFDIVEGTTEFPLP